MAQTIGEMIAKLEVLKAELYDRESDLLRVYGNRDEDFNGNQTRRIAELRNYVELLDRTIKMLEKQLVNEEDEMMRISSKEYCPLCGADDPDDCDCIPKEEN